MRSWRTYSSRRKAVRSHAVWARNNPNALSKHIPNELYLSADERKNTVLPCGYTLAQSWAALRKSWLGFHISHSNKDLARMSEYSHRIKMLQRQIGIQVTKFDPNIPEDKGYEEADEENEDVRNVTIDIDEEESLPEYDEILQEARVNLDGENAQSPEPRNEIFTTHAVKRRNSETHVRQAENRLLEIGERDVRRSCLYRPRQRQQGVRNSQFHRHPSPDVRKKEQENEKPKSCSYLRGQEEEEEEGLEEKAQENEKPKSCSYERK
jgi:hypothetical protein